jgi:hypothetical protein
LLSWPSDLVSSARHLQGDENQVSGPGELARFQGPVLFLGHDDRRTLQRGHRGEVLGLGPIVLQPSLPHPLDRVWLHPGRHETSLLAARAW